MAGKTESTCIVFGLSIGTVKSSPPINFTTSCYAYNENDQFFESHFIQYSIVTNANATYTTILTFKRTSTEWMLSQVINRMDDANAIFQ